jgi:hypothetical protein
MSILFRSLPVVAAMLLIDGSLAVGGLCSLSGSCGDSCASDGCTKSCCPSDYCCKSECKTEEITRHCFETECKPVVIPAIKLPCCKCKLKKLFRGGCGSSSDCCGCSDSGCGDCGSNGCGSNGCGGGLLNKLCSKLTSCKIRCVNTYEKKDYKCGTKCVCKWSAEPKCGSGNGCCSTGSGCGDFCGAESAAPACCAPAGCTQ